MSEMITLGDVLRIARERRGFSLVQMAKLLGVTKQAVYRWEKGKLNIPQARLKQWARVCRIPIGSLISGAFLDEA